MNKIKKILAVFITLSIMVSLSMLIHADVPQQDNIRIGLYYETTAVAQFNVSAAKGLQIGYYKDNKFTALYDENTNNSITVRKDAYFIKNAANLTEYNPLAATIPSGEKSGPFHIKIGGDFNDLNSAIQNVKNLKQKGIVAYTAYSYAWQVWTGFYADQNSAQSDISNNLIKKLNNEALTVVQPSNQRIIISNAAGETIFAYNNDVKYFRIQPKTDNNPYILKVNNKSYRGNIEVRRISGSDMTVINVLSLEQYLYGVVPSEIEAYSNLEALKAQAVTARTYTLNNIGKHSKQDFDLCTTTSCQVYKGFDGEAKNTNKAIDDTKTQNLTYNGKPAQVFYFSSSGGRTEDVKNVWGSDIPYLKSVEDKYESGKSWHYNWEYIITAAKIKEVMMSRGYDLGDILSMTITKLSNAGRPVELLIQGTKNKKNYLRGECRSVFSLDSQWYTISTDADVYAKGQYVSQEKTPLLNKKVMTSSGIKTISSSSNLVILGAGNQKKTIPNVPTTYKLNGKGWGHAIGMSQEGAKGMASAGFTYDQILTHYFPGTKIEQ